MSSNLPYGVTDQTFGAPWNDQTYCVKFVLTFKEEGVQFTSEDLLAWFTVSGPAHYDYEDLYECAKEQIDNSYGYFTKELSYNIDILDINEE